MGGRQDQEKNGGLPLEPPAGGSALPYSVELWDLSQGKPERVIGRAAGVVLARAIFDAALSEYLGRRIVLRRGTKVIAQTE